MGLGDWIKGKLGIQELNQRLDDMESRVGALESSVGSLLGDFGGYKQRTDKELVFMKSQIDKMIEMADNLQKASEYEDGIARAKRLVTRLRGHRTRIQNEMTARAR